MTAEEFARDAGAPALLVRHARLVLALLSLPAYAMIAGEHDEPVGLVWGTLALGTIVAVMTSVEASQTSWGPYVRVVCDALILLSIVTWTGGLLSPWLALLLLWVLAVAVRFPRRQATLMSLSLVFVVFFVGVPRWDSVAASNPNTLLLVGGWSMTVIVGCGLVANTARSIRRAAVAELRLLQEAQERELERAAFDERRALIRVIVHELRGPISSSEQLLTRSLSSDGHQAPIAEYVDIARQQLSQIRQLVEGLAEVGSADDPELPIDTVPAARPITARLLEGAVAAAGAVPGDVQLHTAPAVASVAVPTGALVQIVTNLVSNAVRHGRPPIGVDADVDDGHLVVEVRDSGPGIDAGLPIFDRFWTSSATGQGVGMWIVGELTRRLGGTVEVLDLDSGGAAVRVRIPTGQPRDVTADSGAARKSRLRS